MAWMDGLKTRMNGYNKFMADNGSEPAKPITTARASTYGKSDYFNKTTRNVVDLKKYRQVFEQGGMVTTGIYAYPLYMFRNGYKLEGEDKQKTVVQEVLDRINFDRCAREGAIEALITGDGLQEIVPTQGALNAVNGPESVGALYTRDASRFKFDTDPSGVITGYTQFKDDSDQKGVAIEKEKIIHIQLFHSGEKPWGDSLIGRAFDDIMRDVIINEGSSNAIKRHGFPKYHIKAGSELNQASQADIDNLDKEFQDIGSKNDFVTTHDVEIMNIDQGGITGIEAYDKVSVQRVCAAIGVPGELLGFREGTTDNTAVTRVKSFYMMVETLQKELARTYNLSLIDRITGKPGAVKLVFNPASQPTEDEIITMMQKLASIDPLVYGKALMHQTFDRLGWDWDQFQSYIDEESVVEQKSPEPAK